MALSVRKQQKGKRGERRVKGPSHIDFSRKRIFFKINIMKSENHQSPWDVYCEKRGERWDKRVFVIVVEVVVLTATILHCFRTVRMPRHNETKKIHWLSRLHLSKYHTPHPPNPPHRKRDNSMALSNTPFSGYAPSIQCHCLALQKDNNKRKYAKQLVLQYTKDDGTSRWASSYISKQSLETQPAYKLISCGGPKLNPAAAT